MKIQTKKSKTDSLQVSEMYSDHLHKFYDFETGEKGDCLITNSFIQRFRNKEIKDIEEKYLAWELVQLFKGCKKDLGNTYNFTFYIKDGHIKIQLGYDCAIIKNNLSDYENYLRRLEQEDIESYIEFQLDSNSESAESWLSKINPDDWMKEIRGYSDDAEKK